ncbi:MAG: pentapeptide repeat-containing protein [Alphaproteobacteria bacterium]|nr:pentapeptide repeat-containing protein [Alphaproteobacteria bacterium]
MTDSLSADGKIIWSKVPNGHRCEFADDAAEEGRTIDLYHNFKHIKKGDIDSAGYAMRAQHGGIEAHLQQVREFFANPVEFVKNHRVRPDMTGLSLTHEIVRNCLRQNPNCLEGAQLSGSIINLDGLNGVSLKGIIGFQLICGGGKKIDFSGAYLDGANISKVPSGIFCGANLKGSMITNVPGSDFRPLGGSPTILAQASLAGDCVGAKFDGVDLSGVSVIAYVHSSTPEHLARPILVTDDPVLLQKKQAELAERQLLDDFLDRRRH